MGTQAGTGRHPLVHARRPSGRASLTPSQDGDLVEIAGQGFVIYALPQGQRFVPMSLPKEGEAPDSKETPHACTRAPLPDRPRGARRYPEVRALGRVKKKVLPASGLLSTHILPPWASTMHLEM